jgi:hypothetical protein
MDGMISIMGTRLISISLKEGVTGRYSEGLYETGGVPMCARLPGWHNYDSFMEELKRLRQKAKENPPKGVG